MINAKNTNLLKDFGIDSIDLKLNNKYYRIDDTSITNISINEAINPINTNGYNLLKIKDEPFVLNGIGEVSISYRYLALKKTSRTEVEFYDPEKTVAIITKNHIDLKSLPYSYFKKVCFDVIKIKSLIDKMTPSIKEIIEKTFDIFNIDKKTSFETFQNMYYLTISDKFKFFSKSETTNYYKIFKVIAENHISTQSILNAEPFKDINSLMDYINIPFELLNYVKSDSFNSYNCHTKFNRKEWNKIDSVIQNTLIQMIEHNIISISFVINSIDEINKLPSESLPYIHKFLLKYGILFGDYSIYKFSEYVDLINEAGLSLDLLLNIKKLAYLQATMYLKDHNYNNERVELFSNIIDTDPELAMSLITSKTKLKKKEISEISNIK